MRFGFFKLAPNACTNAWPLFSILFGFLCDSCCFLALSSKCLIWTFSCWSACWSFHSKLITSSSTNSAYFQPKCRWSTVCPCILSLLNHCSTFSYTLGSSLFAPPPCCLYVICFTAVTPCVPVDPPLPCLTCLLSDCFCFFICWAHAPLSSQMYLSFLGFILKAFAKWESQSSSLTNSFLCRFMSWHITCFADTGRSDLLVFWCFNLTLDFKPPAIPLLSPTSIGGLPPLYFSLDASTSCCIWSSSFTSTSSIWMGFPSKVNFPAEIRALIVSIMLDRFSLGAGNGANLFSIFNLFSSPDGLGDEKNEPMLSCLWMPPDEDGVLIGDIFSSLNNCCGTMGLMLSLIKLSLLFFLNLIFGLQSFQLAFGDPCSCFSLLISCCSTSWFSPAWCVSSTSITGSSSFWSSSSPPSSFSCPSSLASCSASAPPPLTSCFFLTAAFSLACAYCWLIYPNIYIYTNTNIYTCICTYYVSMYMYQYICIYTYLYIYINISYCMCICK